MVELLPALPRPIPRTAPNTYLLVLLREVEGVVEEQLGGGHDHCRVGMVQTKVEHLHSTRGRARRHDGAKGGSALTPRAQIGSRDAERSLLWNGGAHLQDVKSLLLAGRAVVCDQLQYEALGPVAEGPDVVEQGDDKLARDAPLQHAHLA